MSLTTTEDLELNRSVNPTEPTALAAGLVQTDLVRFVTKQMLTAYDASAQLKSNRISVNRNQAPYPNTQLGSRLKTVSQLLKSGCRSRVYYTLQPGYDTHAAQLFTHARLLREFSDAMKSFLDDLKSSGLDDRVIMLAFSEFGRRVNENGSLGTDHGTAGPVFLAGSSIKAGLFGSAPDLTNLDDGDLRMNVDFRQVYATVLDEWLRLDSKQILGDSYETLPVL